MAARGADRAEFCAHSFNFDDLNESVVSILTDAYNSSSTETFVALLLHAEHPVQTPSQVCSIVPSCHRTLTYALQHRPLPPRVQHQPAAS
jgi:hypothetical protein